MVTKTKASAHATEKDDNSFDIDDSAFELLTQMGRREPSDPERARQYA